MKRSLALLVLPAFAACGGAAGPSGPPSLSYEVPTPAMATYIQGDTAVVSVDAGGQMIDVTVASQATLDMTFAPAAGGGMQVTTRFSNLRAEASNPMGPPQRVDEDAIEGELVFTVSPTGEGTVVSVPDLDEQTQTFLSPSVLAATLFPRLPGTAVTAGQSWTDTIVVDTEEGPSTIEATSVITYTAAGDTMMAGTNMLVVTFTAEDDRFMEGSQMGMDMSQEITGSSDGWFIWDPVRRLPAEIVINSDGDGSMEVSAAPFPLALRMDNTTRITLQPVAGM